MLQEAYAKALILWERITGRLLSHSFRRRGVIPVSWAGLPPATSGMVTEMTVASNLVIYGLQLWLTGHAAKLSREVSFIFPGDLIKLWLVFLL